MVNNIATFWAATPMMPLYPTPFVDGGYFGIGSPELQMVLSTSAHVFYLIPPPHQILHPILLGLKFFLFLIPRSPDSNRVFMFLVLVLFSAAAAAVYISNQHQQGLVR